MKSRFLPYVDNDTVLNYYALPLVGKSKKFFGDNIVCTKLSEDGSAVFVQVKDDIYLDEVYDNKVFLDDDLYLKYMVPKQYRADMMLIIEGRYSKLSTKAKYLISTKSGLFFNKKAKDGNIYTSKLIFALNKDETLVEYMYDALKSNVEKYDEQLYELLGTVELTERPEEADFIDITNNF